MPRSKSKRSTYTPPKPPKPNPSPPWLPVLGLGVIGLGVVLIILAYLASGLFNGDGAILPIGNWVLVVGFVMMAGGLLVLSQWR
ncbi:MAG: cell division protein CrgA [Nitriliruptorales bacterium]|nr:cell division protein CrgA [Nitriliruptorales bacterium]